MRDAELIRVAAYAGLRQGELLALRWPDVDFLGRKLIVSSTPSADVESTSTKSGGFREVPLPDQAAGAMDRLSRRTDDTGPDEYGFCNGSSRRLGPSALRRRYDRGPACRRLPPLRFHDLRHTYGSLLVAGGVDLISVKSAMGHSQVGTTERYLHARPAAELADRFTTALGGIVANSDDVGRRSAANLGVHGENPFLQGAFASSGTASVQAGCADVLVAASRAPSALRIARSYLCKSSRPLILLPLLAKPLQRLGQLRSVARAVEHRWRAELSTRAPLRQRCSSRRSSRNVW